MNIEHSKHESGRNGDLINEEAPDLWTAQLCLESQLSSLEPLGRSSLPLPLSLSPTVSATQMLSRARPLRTNADALSVVGRHGAAQRSTVRSLSPGLMLKLGWVQRPSFLGDIRQRRCCTVQNNNAGAGVCVFV